MISFDCVRVDGKTIVLQKQVDLDKLREMIFKEEDFILKWCDGDKKKSELFMSGAILPKIKTGEVKLMSEETQ